MPASSSAPAKNSRSRCQLAPTPARGVFHAWGDPGCTRCSGLARPRVQRRFPAQTSSAPAAPQSIALREYQMSRLVRALRNTAAYFKRNLPAYIDDWVQDTKLALTFRMVTYDPDRRLLYQFQNETDLQRFRVVSDREVDGESVAALTLGPERRTGVFSGTLSLQCAREGTRAGYAAIISEPRLRPWDLHLFDAFHVRVRGDGRTYTLNVKTKSGAPKDDIFQCFLKTRADEWSDVVLPFDRFLLTWRGYIKGEQSMNVERIVSLGITLADRAPGSFRLEIAHIAAVQRARLPRQSLGTLA